MAMENPNIEINDDEKQLFAEEIERLSPITVVDTPNLIDEPNDKVVIIEKGGTFSLNGDELTIESSEAIGYSGERISIGHSVTTHAVIAIEGLILARTTTYCADWYSVNMDWHDEDYPHWRTEYETQDTEQAPSKELVVVEGDYKREMKAFYSGRPTRDEVQNRREELALEEEESESERSLPFRFTKARFLLIMPYLKQLNPEHFIRPSQS